MRSIKYEHDFSSDPSLVDKNILVRTSDRIIFDCVSKDFRCSLSLCPADKVSHLTKLLAESMEHLPSELLLICRGRILSQRPNSSLASFGLAARGAYRLFVIRRPVKPAWLRITAHILCCSLPTMPIPMRSSSTAADIKRELRDMLRIPALCLSLHRADGEPLPDGASLRDLGDGERVYCRIHTEDPPPAAAVEAGRVREQIQRAKEAAEGQSRGSNGDPGRHGGTGLEGCDR